ncbi:alanine dehydrogenase [Cryomorpha ignava]|uniref:Alanine dehydrogenase n=1 Tax=Cryomorpha ignava TaxID=101383 RepID=A0A7K3WR93_9FLAO|nr:NAD(P)-dependent oxidoreductase [Cryomorpha ignava]NEN23362.1 alanine dehydrogenase [Cryomorpha ignava]
MTKLGIIREGKTPPDKRVPLTPKQCRELLDTYSNLEIYVQPSPIRAFPDSEYEKEGIQLREDLSNCDILMGVKEVPLHMLIPSKKYMFFSHTFKEQPYNRNLLKAILEKNISLIDYEVLTSSSGKRLVGFGRYAGVVGCYNAMLAVGKKYGLFDLKPAHKCHNRKEVEEELKKVKLPSDFKIVITGNGRVAHGALEILNLLPIKKVSPEKYLKEKFVDPVFTQLSVSDYVKTKDGSKLVTNDFYNDPTPYESNFMRFAKESDLFIPCHYWDQDAPFLFSREDAKDIWFRIKVVADISCDIDGPVASTLRPSTISNPLYGYDPVAESETGFMNPRAIGVMAVDNLPCELPKDASEDFGRELIKNIFPELIGKKKSAVIQRATQTTLEGELAEDYKYLNDYVTGS